MTVKHAITRCMIGLLCLLSLAPWPVEAKRRLFGNSLSETQYLEKMNAALDQISAKTADAHGKPIAVGYNLFYAHGAVIRGVPIDVLKKTVDAFKEAGVHRVDINMGLFPWASKDQATIKKYDDIIEYIRRSGLQLAINPQYTPAVDGRMSFDSWTEKMLGVYGEIAKRYKPDIFVVAHEPTTMAARFNERLDSKQWTSFADQAIRMVKMASPASRCGAGFLVWEKVYFQEFLRLDGLEAIAFDIYNLKDLETYRAMMEVAKSRGKAVYIEETWRNPFYDPWTDRSLEAKSAKGIGESQFQALDVKWMQAITGFAKSAGLEEITFFWPQPLFLYVTESGDALDPSYNRQVMQAIIDHRRTLTYDALKSLH